MKRKTGVSCKVCPGEIVEETIRVHIPKYAQQLKGPGKNSQWIVKTEYYCGDCGLTYKFLPGE